MPRIVDTVERKRERANSRELSFICCTQKIVLIIDSNKVAYILRMDYITT